MLQIPVLAGQSQDASSAQIGDLRAKINDLKLRASDLQTRRDQLNRQVERASAVERPGLERQQGALQHDFMATTLQIDAMSQQLHELETTRDMSRVFALQGPPGPPGPIAGTTQHEVPRDPVRDFVLSDGFGLASFLLLFPFAVALARRLWARSGSRPRVVDLENSPRLQRIEQAIEAIAVEVERIGEAQRFTTKLLSDRQPDAAQRIAIQSRREPGTITPH
jgi:hypothetical protein